MIGVVGIRACTWPRESAALGQRGFSCVGMGWRANARRGCRAFQRGYLAGSIVEMACVMCSIYDKGWDMRVVWTFLGGIVGRDWQAPRRGVEMPQCRGEF